ncbi:FAD-dependent monooxygenase [Microbacterium sp. 22242]|uniref:FAD-dependent monooxygenase n=1 Tax=Microbacterium sp. 22242 TaxID=3453896 RepID=UPI003F879B31
MQFYRDGYRAGSPDIHPAAPEALSRPVDLPETVDVLIVGTGPAGTVLAAQLAAFPGISTRVVERRGGPLELGHADGVAVRTVEMFEAFGLADALLREAYWVNEVRFWAPSEADRDRIERTGWVEDTPEGLSEFPHVIVNQARMQQFLLEHAASSASRLEPDYGLELTGLEVRDGEHPVLATLQRKTGNRAGEEVTVRARYVVGCDGARSAVRRAIGVALEGDAANHAWGVIDALATTDFPDWRTKNVVQSAGRGSLIMIPREGGNMVRIYVDLGEIPAGGGADVRSTTADELARTTNAILHPYSIDVRQVVWSSVYEVGQRLADAFDDAPADGSRGPHVFITGDACHTHSAKAGQGMNVSMQDAFNLGWKLAAVLEGRADAALLGTYAQERRPVAKDLIDFDRYWSDFIAQPTVDPAHPERGGVTSGRLRAEYARQGRYLAGLATVYPPSALIGSDAYQHLAAGFGIGERFHSAPVIRVADARRTQLGHAHRADGRWRLYAFAGNDPASMQAQLTWLGEDDSSPVRRFTPDRADIDGVFDVHGIFRGAHHDVDRTALPSLLTPRSGPLGLQDWEKIWTTDPRDDIFTARGIGAEGALVVVRPDQYVAHVLPLEARDELGAFFAGVLREAR